MWFTSDTHFFHRNVIKSCGRPFNTVEEMNQALIDNWNAKIKSREMVWVLGDFTFAGIEATQNIIKQLNGDIRLVRGNHDRHAAQCIKMGFTNVYENHYIELMINGKRTRVNLSHFPYLDNNIDYTEIEHGEYVGRRQYAHKRMIDTGHYLLCGHVHNAWEMKGRMINVGTDVRDYTPISSKEIIKIIEEDMKSEA